MLALHVCRHPRLETNIYAWSLGVDIGPKFLKSLTENSDRVVGVVGEKAISCLASIVDLPSHVFARSNFDV